MISAKKRSAYLLLLFAFSAIYLVPVFPHYVSANEFSRWATVAGVVEHGTVDVRWSVPLIGPPVDAASFEGRVYSNKAPGLALLAAPGYLLARPFLGPPTNANLRWSLYAMRLSAVTLPALLLGFLFVRSERPDPFAVGTLLFATPIFIYGTLLFSHVTAAALLFAAYRAAFGPGFSPRRLPLAGALCGLLTLTEYPAALATIVMGLSLLLETRPDRFRRVALFVAGGLPFAVAIGVYNRLLFGSFFSLSSSHEIGLDTAELASHGVYGVSLPTAQGAFTILASPARGLLFYSPVLIFGLVSVLTGAFGKGFRERVRLALTATLMLAIAGYPLANGGWCVASRYIILIVPFLVEAASERGVVARFASSLCLGASVVLCAVPILTHPFVPPEIEFVHPGFDRVMLAEGYVTPTLGAFVHPGPVTLIPLLLALVAALALVTWEGGFRAFGGASLGIAVAVAYCLLPIRPDPTARILQALTLDTHFIPRGRLLAMARAAENPTDRAMLLQIAASSAATRSTGPDDWPYPPRAVEAAPRR